MSVCEGYNALSICWVPESDFLQFLQLLQLSVQISAELLQICLNGRYTVSSHNTQTKSVFFM